MGGRRRLRDGLERMFPDARSSLAQAHRREYRLLVSNLGIDGDRLLQREASKAAFLVIQARETSRRWAELTEKREHGKGRRPSAREVERARRASALDKRQRQPGRRSPPRAREGKADADHRRLARQERAATMRNKQTLVSVVSDAVAGELLRRHPLLRLVKTSADQFASPQTIAAEVKSVGLFIHIALVHEMRIKQALIADAADITAAITGPQLQRTLARQGTAIEPTPHLFGERYVIGFHGAGKLSTTTPTPHWPTRRWACGSETSS